MAKKTRNPMQDMECACARAEMVAGFGADFMARTLYLTGEICDETAHRFVTNFRIMDDFPGSIEVILSSPGGSDVSGYYIYDAIAAAKNPVYIVGMGACQSIAAMILQAAPCRLVTPRCRFMIHNGSVNVENNITTDVLTAVSKEISKNNHIYHAILSERSGMPLREVQKLCKDETYFTAEETVENGFADAILMPDGSMKTLDGKDFRGVK